MVASSHSPSQLRQVQLIRKVVLLACIIGLCALAALSRTMTGDEGLHEAMETVGLGLIVVCIVGRAWCSLYIGGRKKAEIVERGPYSVCRNPLYFFTFLGSFGIGAQTGSVVLAFAFLLVAVGVFYATVRQEEAWLAEVFGQPYVAYMARTPRFWPDMSKWTDAETLEIRPAFFVTTLRDGLVFLLAIPLFEALEHAQGLGWVKTLFTLP